MACYQVAVIRRPEGWMPRFPDDVPQDPGTTLAVLAEEKDLFAAVRRATDHNEKATAAHSDRWAVVIEPGSLGRCLPGARLCTPVTYRVTAIWWPQGWEPRGPLDVPNCLWQSPGQSDFAALSYQRAKTTVHGLNRQCMDRPDVTWYIIVAVENESISRTVSFDPGGSETTVEVRRLHVIRPEEGGRGDCSYCPAHAFACAEDNWTSQAHTITARHARSPGPTPE